ncbi:MAG: M3 family oligoendopeptidase, partial [Defluviitaleaceae bacterium]|nr:M3 family oligoendopeptidase [Defluviitaleaceae bacterium]
MKFPDLPYARPDMEALKTALSAAAERIAGARAFAEADAAFLEAQERLAEAHTMFQVSYIRGSIDTKDPFYSGERDFYDESFPVCQELDQSFKGALLRSRFRPDFEAKYNAVYFLNAEITEKALSPELVPYIQRDNALSSEYDKLIASAQIPFEGKTYTLSQLSPLKQDPDDARRRAAWTAEGGWFMENGGELDRIYDEMVRLRTEMGQKAGYENFVPLGYDS